MAAGSNWRFFDWGQRKGKGQQKHRWVPLFPLQRGSGAHYTDTPKIHFILSISKHWMHPFWEKQRMRIVEVSKAPPIGPRPTEWLDPLQLGRSLDA